MLAGVTETPGTLPPLPPGLLCPVCRYDVGGQTERRCPECGLYLDAEIVHLQLSDEAFWERLHRELTGYVLLSGLMGFWLSMEMGWATGLAMVSLVTAAAVGAVVLAAVLLVLGASIGMARHERCDLVARCRRSMVWLTTPLFCAVPLNALLALIDMAVRLEVINQTWANRASLSVMLVFLATPIAGFALAVRAYRRRARGGAGVYGARTMALVVGGLVLLALSTVVGGACLAAFADALPTSR